MHIHSVFLSFSGARFISSFFFVRVFNTKSHALLCAAHNGIKGDFNYLMRICAFHFSRFFVFGRPIEMWKRQFSIWPMWRCCEKKLYISYRRSLAAWECRDHGFEFSTSTINNTFLSMTSSSRVTRQLNGKMVSPRLSFISPSPLPFSGRE